MVLDDFFLLKMLIILTLYSFLTAETTEFSEKQPTEKIQRDLSNDFYFIFNEYP